MICRFSWNRVQSGSATLLAYFFFAVLLCGGCGVWLALAHFKSPELLKRPELLLAMLSFAWAVAGASCTDFIFGKKENYVRAIPVYAAVFLILLSLLALVCGAFWQYFFAIVSAGVAGMVWWIANAENPDLADDSLMQSPAGGDTNKDVPGEMKGYQG